MKAVEECKRVMVPEWESNLRLLCKEFMRKALNQGFDPQYDPMLSHISSVGATRSKGGDLSTSDKIRLYNGIEYFLYAGFVVDPDFTIDPVQIKDRRDFLEEDKQTDLVICNFLADKTITKGPAETSPLSWIPDAWYQRTKKGNVKAVINEWGGLSINRFKGPGYRTIITKRSCISCPEYQEYEYAFQDEYLLQMLKYLDLDTLMTKDIIHDMQSPHRDTNDELKQKIYYPPPIPSQEHT